MIAIMAFKNVMNKLFGKVFKNTDWLNISPAVYCRYILAIIAAINTLLNVFNINPINVNNDQLYEVVSAILFIVILFVNTYEDNPTSSNAIESNKYFQMLQRGEKKKIVDADAECEDSDNSSTNQ